MQFLAVWRIFGFVGTLQNVAFQLAQDRADMSTGSYNRHTLSSWGGQVYISWLPVDGITSFFLQNINIYIHILGTQHCCASMAYIWGNLHGSAPATLMIYPYHQENLPL